MTTLFCLFSKRQFRLTHSILLSLFGLFWQTSSAQTPTISSFSPVSQLANQNVTISGSNFGTTKANVTVKFGGSTGTVVSVNSTTIVATVPTNAKSGTIGVTITGQSEVTISGFVFMRTIDALWTDYTGYWFSESSSPNTVQPDLSHNVLAFRYNNTIYSTGVTDSILDDSNVTYTAALWKALPASSFSGSNTNAVGLYPSKKDGDVTKAINPNWKIKDFFIDGKNGLDLGTGVANFDDDISFTVTDIDDNEIGDGEPDLLLTQVAAPSSNSPDEYWFEDASGNQVGNKISAISALAPAMGSYLMDLYSFTQTSNDNAVTTTFSGGNGVNTSRDIRFFAYDLEDFGINSSNYSSIDKLMITPNGTSDYAFIAYNANTFIVPTADVSSQPTSTTSCAGSGSSATFSVTASNPSSVGTAGGTITYQWKKDGTTISGATSDSYTISPITASDFGEYTCEITNNYGTVVSDPAYLNVKITVEPTNDEVCQNGTGSVSLTAVGNSPTYQWYSNSSNSYSGATSITGATSSTYAPTQSSSGTVYYFCVVSDPNASGCTIDDTSSVATVVFSPTSVAGTLSGGQTVCYPTNSTTLTLSGKTGDVVRWESATNSSFSSKSNLTITTTSRTFTNVPSDRYYRAVVQSGSCTEAVSNSQLIDVNTTYTWEGDVSTDFGTATNWVEGCIPHTGADISFRTTTNPDRICNLDQSRTLNDITIGGSSSTHIFDLNNESLTLTGDLTLNGANMDVRDGSSHLIMQGSSSQSIPSGGFVDNEIAKLTVNNSSGVSVGGTTYLTRLLTMTAGTLTTNNNLTFRSTADFTGQLAPFPGSGASISGNVTVEKYVKARRAFRLLSPTVTTTSTIKENWQENGATYQSNPNPGFGTHITGSVNGSDGFDATLTGNPSLFTFDNSAQSWNSIANTNVLTLSAGTPYRLMIRGGRNVNIYQMDNNPSPTNTVIRTNGTLSTGDFTYNNLSSTADADNFVGNPYQCAVDLSSVITSSNSNLDYTKVYMWDPFLNIRGGWATVTLSNNTASPSSSSASKYLQPGQSFFVSTASSPSSAPSITFSENDKYTGGTFETVNLLSYESPRNPYINLVLINNDSGWIADETFIKFHSRYENTVDLNDAKKLWNLDEVLATKAGNRNLSINARALPKEEDVIPILLAQNRVKNYTFRFQVNGMSEYTITLWDKLAKEYYDIDSDMESEWSFSAATNNPNDRFELLVAPKFSEAALSRNNINRNGVRVYPNPAKAQLHVQVVREITGSIQLKDLMGRVLMTHRVNANTDALTLKLPENLRAGSYILTVPVDGQLIQKKVIIE